MKPWIFAASTWLAVTVLGAAQGLPGGADAQSGVPFELNREFGSILVRVQVNGQPATMVVDTGSSRTILSREILRLRPQEMPPAEAPHQGSGLVGSAAWAKATLQLGTTTWPDRKVLVMGDFHEISSSMKQKVDGILGEDVLREFSYVGIDFKHQRLVLLR